MEAAVLLPSGSMCNEIALNLHCEPGTEVICERSTHIVNFEAGALTEPLACVVHGVLNWRTVAAGDVAVIAGPGAIGLLTLQVLKASGATVVLLGTDVDETRLALGRELGADHVVNHREDMVAQTRALGLQRLDDLFFFRQLPLLFQPPRTSRQKKERWCALDPGLNTCGHVRSFFKLLRHQALWFEHMPAGGPIHREAFWRP